MSFLSLIGAGRRVAWLFVSIFLLSSARAIPEIAEETGHASLRARMEEVMGPLPGDDKRVSLDIEIVEEVDCGSYVRQKITYRAEPGNRVPAYLLIPKAAHREGARLPAVLCLHPTDLKRGSDVAVGLTEKRNRSYAAELAERGFVTIAPTYPLMADHQPDLEKLGYESGTMKAIWDNIRALDLLDSLPFVDHTAYGAIGHSLGGHNAIFTASFDQRIQAVVSSCGFDSFQAYMDGNIAGWTSRRYMPNLLKYPLAEIPFDFDDLLAALAPRRVFVSAPVNDHNFKWKSVAEIGKTVAPAYALHQASENLTIVHPDAGHDFPEEIRVQAYAVLGSPAASPDEK